MLSGIKKKKKKKKKKKRRRRRRRRSSCVNRTVHTFPVKPYGGKVDMNLEWRARNVLGGATVSLSSSFW